MNDDKFSFLEHISKQCAFQKSLTLNRPYDYKGVTFYPVGVEYIIEFYLCLEALTVKQERTKDKKLMKLPYLWFLAYAYENWEQYQKPEYGLFIPLLYGLFELVTRQNDVSIQVERDEKGNFKKCVLNLCGVELNYKDFNEIRQIIFAQAGIEHSDEFLNSDTERNIHEGRLYEQKKSGYVPPTLENLIDILAMYLHKSTDELTEKFTIRKFNNLIRYMSSFEEWKLLKGGEYSGMVTFKKPIPHWISGFAKQDIFADQNTDYKNSSLMKV